MIQRCLVHRRTPRGHRGVARARAARRRSTSTPPRSMIAAFARAARGDDAVAVDLTDAQPVDHEGAMALIVNSVRRLQRRRGDATVVCPPGPVRAAFEHTAVSRRVRLVADPPAIPGPGLEPDPRPPAGPAVVGGRSQRTSTPVRRGALLAEATSRWSAATRIRTSASTTSPARSRPRAASSSASSPSTRAARSARTSPRCGCSTGPAAADDGPARRRGRPARRLPPGRAVRQGLPPPSRHLAERPRRARARADRLPPAWRPSTSPVTATRTPTRSPRPSATPS